MLWYGSVSPSLHIRGLLTTLQHTGSLGGTSRELLQQLQVITQIKEQAVDMKVKEVLDEALCSLLTLPIEGTQAAAEACMQPLCQVLVAGVKLQVDTLTRLKSLTSPEEYAAALVVPFRMR